MEAALERAVELPEWEALAYLLERIVAELRRERYLFQAILREARFLLELPATQRELARLFGVGLLASRRARARLALPRPELDAWLVGRMLAPAALDVALANVSAAARAELTRELARLAFRMLQARDPEAPRAAR